MLLNNETGERVRKLLRIPSNTVEYNGASAGGVNFFVGMRDECKNWQSGAHVTVSEEFKIIRVQRIREISVRSRRYKTVETKTLPFA